MSLVLNFKPLSAQDARRAGSLGPLDDCADLGSPGPLALATDETDPSARAAQPDLRAGLREVRQQRERLA